MPSLDNLTPFRLDTNGFNVANVCFGLGCWVVVKVMALWTSCIAPCYDARSISKVNYILMLFCVVVQ